jgi:Flp pilus assembly pilin Flp
MRARRDRGATATEYALLVALFVVALIASVDYVRQEGTDTLSTTDQRVGVIEDTGAYQAPAGPGGPTPPTLPPPPTGTLALPLITPAGASDAHSKWTAFATITVLDLLSGPVGGVNVEFTWSSGTSPSDSCVTNSSGTCMIQQSVVDTTPVVTVTITSMAKAGWGLPLLPVVSLPIPCSPPLLPLVCDAL